jgi:murein tripeptide amidase MpaA
MRYAKFSCFCNTFDESKLPVTTLIGVIFKINLYLTEVEALYPELATIEPIGLTYEGRQQKVLKLSNGPVSGRVNIFIDAAIHAAEWQGPAVALNIIYQLTANYSANVEYLNKANWYILPVANPDGYEYSWTEVGIVKQKLIID